MQRLVSGDDWSTVSTVTINSPSDREVSLTLETTADGNTGDTLEYRVLLLDSGVEKERISIEPLMIKEEVERDGEALANQLADSQLSVVMYLIALGAMSYAVWTMVQMRRIKRGDELDESDQTAEVVENMGGKVLPTISPDPMALPAQGQGHLGIPNPNQPPLVQNVINVGSNIPAPPPTPPPLPPSGLPAGWTIEQWSHYGHQYIETLESN